MRSATNHSPFHFALLAGLLLLIGVQQAMGDSWIDPASMPTPRRLLAAAVYGGKVYTFGGCGSPCFQPPLHTSIVEETTVEVYDPQADHHVNLQASPQSLPWATKQAMPTILYGAAAAAPGNKRIYTAGGYLSGNVLQEYDPEKDSWRLRRPMPTARYGAAAVALNDKVYVLGGSGPSAALEEYDPATDTWTPRAPMPTARVFLAAAVAGGEIYAIGGSPDCCGGAVTAAVEIYHPATDTWRRGPSLFVAEQVSAAVELNGRIDVFGGFVPGSGVRASTYEYDPDHPALGWMIKAPMPTARDQAPAVALDGRAFVLGGSTDCHCRARAENGGYTPDSPLPSPSADLAISISGAARVSSCTPIQYTIEVTNLGPDPVVKALVTWTCRLSNGAPCAHGAGGTFTVDLPANGSVSHTVTAALDPTATGDLLSTATVEAPAGAVDSDLSNNSATASASIDPPNADLEVQVVSAPGSIGAGGDLAYSVLVTNHGPCTAYDVVLTDSFPAAASAPARVPIACKRSESTLPCSLGDLEKDQSTQIRVVRKIPCDHPVGRLDITVSASHARPQRDIPSTNNQAVIPAIVDPPVADLAVAVAAPDSVIAGESVAYSVNVTNHGPCPASGVVLTDSTPGAVLAVSKACELAPGNLLRCSLGDLARDESTILPITREVLCSHLTGALGGTLTVSGKPPALDPLANNSVAMPTQVVVRADYAIEKTGPSLATPGSTVEYSIIVTNYGPSCPPEVHVRDTFPPELFEPRWCYGAPCTPARRDPFDDIVGLPPWGTATYLAAAVVPSTFLGTFVNTATVEVPFGNDPFTPNNAAPLHTRVLPAPPPCVDCSIPTLSDAGLLVFALLLALVSVVHLRRGSSL